MRKHLFKTSEGSNKGRMWLYKCTETNRKMADINPFKCKMD